MSINSPVRYPGCMFVCGAGLVMAGKSVNRAFAERLKAGVKEEIPETARAAAEQVLGKDSLQYQLSRNGFRQLLEELDRSRQNGG